jgi:hypothetical protein
MKKLAAFTLSLILTTGTAFADSPKDTPKEADAPAAPAAAAKAKTNAQIAKELDELRQTLQTQQEQLAALKEALAKRDRDVEDARKAAADANARAAEAGSKATDAVNGTSEVKSGQASLNNSVNDLRASNDALKASIAKEQEDAKKAAEKGATTIRFKGVNITPGGFIAAETVNRQRAQSADINTPFTAVPYGGNATGKLTEMNLTGRQSRLSLMVDGKVGETKLAGYYEMDWLGTGVTSNNRQSNSYVVRQRQIWGRAEFANGFSFSAGQMWSLATENRKGIRNLQEWIPLTIDPQYVVGFDWQRAYGARLAKNFGDKFALAVAIEGPQTTIGGRGFSTYTNTSATGVVTTSQNAFVFAPGAGGGLLNFVDTTGYSANKTPDFIFKAALDPGWGHYEVFGIVSAFRNRVYPCAVVGTTAGNFPMPAVPTVLSCAQSASLSPSNAGAFNDSRTGGGGGASLDVPLFAKKLDVGAKVFYGDGTGRYGSAQLADATMRPDGTLALIRGGQWLGRLEWHATKKLDIYGYVGGEYAARTAYTGYQTVKIVNTPAIPGCGDVGQQPCAGGGIQPGYPALTTTSISTSGIGGYGSPFASNQGCSTETLPTGTGAPGGGGTCHGDTRYIGEGTLGFWHKFYQGEKGRVQWGIQYSYFYKTGWSGNNSPNGTSTAAGVSPHAVDNMVWTSFRYYLP